MPMSLSRRIATLLAALAAAACFALAVQGGRWWRVHDHFIGTTASETCFDTCQSTTLEWTGGSDVWQRAGIATWAAGMVATLVLVALAGALAANGPGRLAAAVALVASMTAIVSGAVFHQYRPALEGIQLARGSYLFGAAIIFALGAAISTLRVPPPPPPTRKPRR